MSPREPTCIPGQLSLASGLLAAPVATEAQQAGTARRLGYLATGFSTMPGFRETLRSLGWIEFPNLVIEYPWAELPVAS